MVDPVVEFLEEDVVDEPVVGHKEMVKRYLLGMHFDEVVCEVQGCCHLSRNLKKY